ncbi:MAG: hypothetical protein NTZ33_00690 [Bacteroidetes bacterium]|nr:hypothetical protein [Bacteroidota bacterium]
MKTGIISFILLLCSIAGFSQKTDTVVWARNKTTYFYDKANTFDFPEMKKIDTILKGFQQYNPSFNQKHFTEWSGNIGRASKSMIFDADYRCGFDYGVHSFDDIMFTNYSQPYYQVFKPYTSITYISGPQKEDVLQVIHSQNINNSWNVALNFRVMDSWGTYQLQSCDDRQLMINTNYVSPKGKYRVLAAYYHNSIEIQENGGLYSDSIFENKVTSQSLSIPVNLQNASNQWKETGYFVKQFYNFKKVSNDSTKSRTFNPGSVSYTIHYVTQSQTYADQDGRTGFYNNIYFDSTATHDSIHFRSLENNFAWTNGINENPLSPKALNLIFGIKQKYYEVKDTARNFSFNQITPYAALSVFAFGKFHLNLNGEYVIGDYNGGDFSLKGIAKFDFIKNKPSKGTIIAGINYCQKQAGWIYEWNYSNYYRWNKSFDKQNFITSFVGFQTATFNATLSLHQINNYVYLNNDAQPEWHDKMIHLINFKLSKNLSWKFLQIDNDFVYQYTADKSIIKLPQITAMQSWYFNLHLFNKYLYLQPGFSLFYNTAYYADSYSPALRMFYNQDSKKIGNYLYTDLFVNMQIKRANIFIKYQHLNSGWTGYNFYMIPHYPQQSGALKIGITWRFYD